MEEVDELGPILRKYNSTVHSTTEMTPNRANDPANELVVAWTLSKNLVKKRMYPDLSTGDRVRVLLKQDVKRKGYEPKWSEAIFKVTYKRGGEYLVDDGKKRVYGRHELQLAR